MKGYSRLHILRCMIVFGLLSCSGCGTGSLQQNTGAPVEDGAALERTTEKGPVKLTLWISPKEPRLSDLIEMDIDVFAESDVEIKAPEFGRAVGDFLVRDYSDRSSALALESSNGRNQSATPSKPSSTDGASGAVQGTARRFHYQLEPVNTGRHLIRSIGIEFVDRRANSEAKGQTSLIESEPVELNITSELGDQVPDLANLEPMVPPQPIADSSSWYWMGLGIVGAIAAGLLLWRWKSRRSRQPEPRRLSPEEIAHAALATLLAENLPEQGLFKEFYLRLTGIVRQYIEGTTGLRAPEQTTEEFLRAIRSREVFTVDRSNRLIEFLEAADMVKYAGQTPAADQIAVSIMRAREFVDMRHPTPTVTQTLIEES